MTLPVPQGAPDYSRQSPWSDQVFINDVNVTPVVGFRYNAFYVGNIRALLFVFTPAAAAGRLILDAYSDPALLDHVDSTIIDTGNGQKLFYTFRPYAPYLQITPQGAGAGAVTYSLYVASMSDVDAPLAGVSPIVLINRNVQNINAGAIVTDAAIWGHVGEVYVQMYCTAAAWNADLRSLDVNGNVSILARTDNTTGRMAVHTYSPGGTLQIVTNNRDGVAKLYEAFLIARPLAST